MPPEDQTPDEHPSEVLIPATAEEVEGKRRRVRWSVLLAFAVVVGAVVYTYFTLTAPGRAAETYDLAFQHFNNARYEQSILALDRALNYRPNFPEAYMLRGLARFQRSLWKESVGDFTRVIEMQPENPQGYVNRARALVELKAFSKAGLDCESAIKLDARLAAPYRIKGIVIRELGDPEHALTELSRAVELEPVLQNYLERGATYQKLGMHKVAIKDFDEAHRLDPINPQPLYARAQSKREIGDEKGAKIDHEAARKIEGGY